MITCLCQDEHIMSEGIKITETADTRLLTEYKDGPLQIVEVRPFEKEDAVLEGDSNSLHELDGDGETKYVQLVNAGDKSMMQLDLLNLTLIRCEDGTQSYRLVASGESSSSEGTEATVTCVLASSDNEGAEDEVMYPPVEQGSQETYVMVDGDQGPLVLLRSSLPTLQPAQDTPSPVVQEPKGAPKLTPMEILERAKAVQRAKAFKPVRARVGGAGSAVVSGGGERGRRRASDLPPPLELLASPNFKLFLYSCKMCSFKCNAIKEMTAHKALEHGPGGGKWRGRAAPITLQCARCPFKGTTHSQLMKHVQEMHLSDEANSKFKVYLNTEEVQSADVLVCGACGFESSSRPDFKRHIEDEHGATTC